MKRSEMETILQEFIDHQEHYGYSINAGTILEIVEKAGMLPPKITNPRIYEEDCYDPMKSDRWNIIEVIDYYRAGVPYKTEIHAWEKE